MASEEAKKLLDNLLIPFTATMIPGCEKALELINYALNAAEQRGREQPTCPVCLGKPISGKGCICDGSGKGEIAYLNLLKETKCHDPGLCDGCAALVKQGREEKRAEVISGVRRFADVSLSTIVRGEILAVVGIPELAPPSPAIPAVPEWATEAAREAIFQVSPAALTIPRLAGIIATHAPQPNAEAIVEAVWKYAQCLETWKRTDLAAVVNKALEARR